MTDYLYIVFNYSTKQFDSVEEFRQNLCDEIKEFISSRHQECLPQKFIQRFRIILRKSDDEYFLEPFIGSSSLSATLSIKKKYINSLQVLLGMVNWARKYSEKVQILFCTEYASGMSDSMAYLECKAEDILSFNRKPFNTRINIISELDIFYVLALEAVLIESLGFGENKSVSGFFCNYYIAMKNGEDLFSLLDEEVSKSNALVESYGEISKIKYHLLSDREKDFFDFPVAEGVLYRSGKVYFDQ